MICFHHVGTMGSFVSSLYFVKTLEDSYFTLLVSFFLTLKLIFKLFYGVAFARIDVATAVHMSKAAATYDFVELVFPTHDRFSLLW